MNILNLVKSDFFKMKRTEFYLIHIIMPLLGASIFLLYYSNSNISEIGKIEGFIEVLAITFPTLIAIVTSSVVKEEYNCGKYKEMLGTQYGKVKCFISKFIMLIISGFVSLSVAILYYALIFHFVLKQNTFNFKFYINLILILFFCEIFLYLFHLVLSFQFENGLSLMIGIFESMVSALFITGLGSGLWMYVPCSWGVRITNYYIYKYIGYDKINLIFSDIKLGIINCIIFTMLIIFLSCIWFKFYESKMEK